VLKLEPEGLSVFEATLVDELGAGIVGWDTIVESGRGLERVGVLSLDVCSTGGTVLGLAAVDVITLVDSAGQLVTVGAQLIMVTS
jgi:hypothetical protein